MNLTRWQRPEILSWPSLSRLTNLRDEFDRLFEAPLSELARTSGLLSGWNLSLDIYEDKDHFTVTADLPGMKKEDINISLHDGTLSLSGERKTSEKFDDADVYRSERFIGRFQRTIPLPTQVNAEKVKAQYKDGVLTITLPKAEEARPKQINVQVG